MPEHKNQVVSTTDQEVSLREKLLNQAMLPVSGFANPDIKVVRRDEVEAIINVIVSEAVKKERETTANDLKQILNRCKTERGLGTAIANFIRSKEQ